MDEREAWQEGWDWYCVMTARLGAEGLARREAELRKDRRRISEWNRDVRNRTDRPGDQGGSRGLTQPRPGRRRQGLPCPA